LRNSIILVDFIELRIRQGMPLAEAVIDAGATRFRPMLLTAAAVVVGASMILSDPIFQGLALSLIAGAVASTFMSSGINRSIHRKSCLGQEWVPAVSKKSAGLERLRGPISPAPQGHADRADPTAGVFVCVANAKRIG
jgi:hypothetical protein